MTFGMTATGGSPVTVNLGSISGQPTPPLTLVYQVDYTGGVFTITPQDITQKNGFNNVLGKLIATGTPVKVFGVPQAGNLTAYVLFYFTGVVPTQ
jgi:hypothetical protein